MPATTVRGGQVRDGSLQRADLDDSTVGQAVVRKIVQGTSISISSSGADSGTGDVTVSVAANSIGASQISPNSIGASEMNNTQDMLMATMQSITISDTTTTLISSALRLDHATSNVASTNFGVALWMRLESAAGTMRDAAQIAARWADAADASRTSYIDFLVVKSAGSLASCGKASPDGWDIRGTTTNDNAAAGECGETVASKITAGSAVSFTNNQTKNLTSISLTAGDWDVRGAVTFILASMPASTFFQCQAQITQTTGVITDDGMQSNNSLTSVGVTTGLVTCALAPRRISLASTTTIYLVGDAPSFASGTCTAYGFLEARRVR